jgi:hypothetical protein
MSLSRSSESMIRPVIRRSDVNAMKSIGMGQGSRGIGAIATGRWSRSR